jgi:hypothetical protein
MIICFVAMPVGGTLLNLGGSVSSEVLVSFKERPFLLAPGFSRWRKDPKNSRASDKSLQADAVGHSFFYFPAARSMRRKVSKQVPSG